jgi:DNA-binding NtrC family response regulator
VDAFRILVVDDEPSQLELVGGFLKKRGFETLLAESGPKALEVFRAEPVDLVLTDQKMADMSGLELLKAIRAINPEAAAIVITAYGTVETAVAAIKAGAADYVAKPVNLDELLFRIDQVRERRRLVSENRELRETLEKKHRIEGIIGESGGMIEVLSLVRRVAPSEATVLIRGESGTGKELIAKAIHYASARASGPMIRVNCAALPETLLESELFGHEKGAFTGAVAARRGRFELADKGTLFSRRDRRSFVAAASEASPRPSGAGVRARRLEQADPRRCAHSRRDASRSRGARQGTPVSRRPLLSAERRHDSSAAS